MATLVAVVVIVLIVCECIENCVRVVVSNKKEDK